MAVDFYKYDDKHSVLFSLNDEDFKRLAVVFEEYKKLTGIVIDQYGATRISHGHVKLISRILATHLSRVKGDSVRLKSLLNNFKSVDTEIMVVGD